MHHEPGGGKVPESFWRGRRKLREASGRFREGSGKRRRKFQEGSRKGWRGRGFQDASGKFPSPPLVLVLLAVA